MTDDSPSESDLPDDIRTWPTDPEKLLGVTLDATRKDLKRAYTRLIKRFKPEHAPEQFRRLREAYEHLDQQMAWKERYRHSYETEEASQDESDGNLSSQTAVTAVFDSPVMPIRVPQDSEIGPTSQVTGSAELEHSSSETAGNQSNNRDIEDLSKDTKNAVKAAAGVRIEDGEKSSDQLWQQAIDGGDLAEAYRGFLGIIRRKQATEVDYARLFWMLSLCTELDPDRDPCAWLLEGVRQSNLQDSRLIPILDTEIRRRRGRAPLILADDLVNGDQPPNILVNLLATRWYAARRQERYDLIESDFLRVQRRFIDEPVQWLRLLGLALRSVLLSGAHDIAKRFQNELSQQTSNPAQNWIWDGLELDLNLHEAWKEEAFVVRSYEFLAKSIRTLLENTWLASTYESRTDVIDFCLRLKADSGRRLKELQYVEQVARPVMLRLWELIVEQHAESDVEQYTEITPAIDGELQWFISQEFQKCESESFPFIVMEFCIFEAVTPRDIIEALKRIKSEVPDWYFLVADRIAANLSLNCMVYAHRLLW